MEGRSKAFVEVWLNSFYGTDNGDMGHGLQR